MRLTMVRRLHPVRLLRLAGTFILITIVFIFLLHHLPSSLFSSGKRLSQEQVVLNYMSNHLNVYYRLLANEHDSYHVDITLTNTGPGMISSGNWSLYFHHIHFIDTEAFNRGKSHSHRVDILTLNHVNSYLFCLRPTLKFPNLTTDEYVTFKIRGQGWITGRSDVFPNWYVSFDSKNGVLSSEPRVVQSTLNEDVDFVAAFDEEKKWKRAPGDFYEPYAPEDRFIKNNLPLQTDLSRMILPKPVSMTQDKTQSVTVTKSWTISYLPAVINEADYLSSRLKLKTRGVSSEAKAAKHREIILLVDGSILGDVKGIGDEGYKLTVNAATDLITIKGRTPAGTFYGIQSLLQLISPLDELPAKLAAVRIVDYPRLSYRGLMLDVVRNFHNKWAVMQQIEIMSQYKMNRLHLHLADDEGWRLEIPGLPELTQVGGQRCHDPQELVCLMPMLGSGPHNNTSGTGFYSTSDYQEILAFAQRRHLMVIPEFDMPGHSHAAIKSMEARYFRLASAGDIKEAHKYLLSDLRDRSAYYSGQFFMDSAVNPCIESTYAFVEHVMKQVVHLHANIQPLQTFHMGGDEVPEAALTHSPACEAFRSHNPTMKTTKQLKTYFVLRVSDIARSLNLGLQGWEDAFTTHKGTQMAVADLNLPHVVSNAWYHVWCSGNEGNTYASANAGYKVVLTSTSHLYFDNPQEPDPEDWGLSWATRYVDTKRTFFYQPDSFYDNIDFGFFGDRQSKDSCCAVDGSCVPLSKPENIIGISGALWTEEVRTKSRLHHMLWPRLLALAERAWHKAEWEELTGDNKTRSRQQDWAEFADQVGRKEMLRLDQQGIHYYIPPPGIILQSEAFLTNTMFPGLQTQWSKDASVWYNFQSNTKLSGKVYFSTLSADGQRRSRIITYHVPTDT